VVISAPLTAAALAHLEIDYLQFIIHHSLYFSAGRRFPRNAARSQLINEDWRCIRIGGQPIKIANRHYFTDRLFMLAVPE
jgi:hypothetical protein